MFLYVFCFLQNSFIFVFLTFNICQLLNTVVPISSWLARLFGAGGAVGERTTAAPDGREAQVPKVNLLILMSKVLVSFFFSFFFWFI